MTWEEEVVARVKSGFAEDGRVPNMVAVLFKDKKRELWPMPSPDAQGLIKREVSVRKKDIEELALIANIMEADVSTEEMLESKMPKHGGEREAVMIMFESRGGLEIRRFKIEGKQLVDAGKASGVDIHTGFTFGLFEQKTDFGGMYR